jgi:type II secretory pathway pseudopilin PulG
MSTTLKFLLASQMKRSKLAGKIGGFTLLELLVAMILAILVITPLLALAVNLIDTDRREQAKANSEQEIQTALNYIAQDLQQAVYVYDVNGVERNNNAVNTSSGIKDQIPPVSPASNCPSTNTTCTPVLVFWKRQLLDKDTTIGGSSGIRVGTATNVNSASPSTVGTGDDAAVYSLIAYYLIKDTSCTTSNTWSCAARIGRWESRGGIRAPSSAAVNGITPTARVEGKQADGTTDNTVYYLISPTLGFMPFNLTLSGDLGTQMNQWKKHSTEAYNVATSGRIQPDVQILTDYIDQSAAATFGEACTTTQQQVPSTITGGFYVCVDSSRAASQGSVVKVFIRGNALARISPKTSPPTYSASTSTSNYFPKVSIQVQGRGLLGGQ